MRFAVDTGGTFTDLVIEEDDGSQTVYKSPTVPSDQVRGVLDVFQVAADARGVSRELLLGLGSMLIHGTTHAINAVLTHTTPRTAFLTTEGHPDVLVLREGGRNSVFDFSRPYPEPYVPRALTFEVPERIDRAGGVIKALDEAAFATTLEHLRQADVKAVGVCLLWSIANPVHELRVGELLAEHLPGVAVTLSHELSGAVREYRRASSCVIDASLKPIMGTYLGGLAERLTKSGFAGRLLVVTSNGAVRDASEVAGTPILALNSGPAMAPVAGRHFAREDFGADTAIVADTGGTTYDVSVVRRGRIPSTRETWLGEPFSGHITGFPSVDVKSVGAGGGSIAWVDSGGLLHVGPQSAGAVPGPACYSRGGTQPTLTDACVALGLLDPAFFLGGTLPLDAQAARTVIDEQIARPLGLSVVEASSSILALATECMVSAIEEITIHQGIDPRQAVLVGGGGAAGLNTVAIAQRIGCPNVIIPAAGPALSAAGGLLSDLAQDFDISFHSSDVGFDLDGANAVLAELERRCQAFVDGPGADAVSTEIEYWVEAHYPNQIWDLEVELAGSRFSGTPDVDRLRERFHTVHEEVFAVADRHSGIEVERWHARARCHLERGTPPPVEWPEQRLPIRPRQVYRAGRGWTEVDIWRIQDMDRETVVEGPAVIESALTTVVVDEGARARRIASGALVIETNTQTRSGGAS
ncbi:hydantoinase/oxoprolinase family protein [Cryptosporangium sp. NPDC051539]|uniref:hydantoinase/oxoprolinase family protein n=1 Tax=Cryptosporangium sp. NPDC051539 TaxID=3363962 RepID=UPI003788F8A8